MFWSSVKLNINERFKGLQMVRLDSATKLPTAPGNKTVCRIASGHHDGFPVRNPAGTIPTVT